MFEATLTTLGLAKIANAIATSTPLALTAMKVGDGNGNITDPSPEDTDLVRVVYSAAPNSVRIDTADETRVIAEMIVPANEGGWVIREIGIYDADNDLIAVSRFPEIYKPLESEGATTDIVCRLFLVVSNTAAITLQVDTSVVIATRSWVNQQLALLIPGGTTDQVLTKNSNAEGDYEWRDATDITVTVDTVLEEQTLTGSQTIVNLATCTTDNLAVYVEGIRLHPADWTANTATQIQLATTYAAGSKILCVQNDPTGTAQFLKSANNLSDVSNKAQARANLELLTSATYLDALWSLMQQRTYPVGEILTTRRAGNPSTWMGFGTWERYGEGRVLVGFDGADGAFNALDKTGGAKSHVLTVAELPPHSHDLLEGGADSQADGPYHDSSNRATTLRSATQLTGGGQAHNNLQPYITVFMWRRTA
jgi:phage-related tail fiber protein